jgi:hypothetical protein
MITVTACDRHGIIRCYGRAETAVEAYSQARLAVVEYVRRRPDLAPADSFLLESDEQCECQSRCCRAQISTGLHPYCMECGTSA